MANETKLVLSGNGVAPYSARGLTQTIDLIDAASNTRRSINGSLNDLSQAQFRKYKSTISCNDHLAPALSGIWPGMPLTVDCVAELSYLTATGAPERTVVATRTEGAYTYYTPRLIMRVMSYTTSHDEYGAQVGWSLDLEEI
jgi:hypothetical protein